jgi:L-lactate dehydrogenase complex protein LldG
MEKAQGMSAREAIFARLKRQLAAGSSPDERRKTASARIADHAANLIPARARIGHAEQVKLFIVQAEAVQATVKTVASHDEIPDEVTSYLRKHNLPQAIRHGADERLTGIDWNKNAPSLTVSHGPADPADEASLSHAIAGVAETGTLILTSGADNPTTLNFLPENHIAVVRAKDITGSYEDVWQTIRATYGERELPRTVNLITGPSRTGDIEQRIELGAHGPRRLHIIIVKD